MIQPEPGQFDSRWSTEMITWPDGQAPGPAETGRPDVRNGGIALKTMVSGELASTEANGPARGRLGKAQRQKARAAAGSNELGRHAQADRLTRVRRLSGEALKRGERSFSA
jgi:hypothetical protein